MTETGSHWSRPGALRFGAYLMSRGRRASGWEICRDLQTTGARDPANDLRCLLQVEHGYSRRQANHAVLCFHERTTDRRRKVYVYELSEEVRVLFRRLRAEVEMPAPEAGHQSMLFNTHSEAADRRRA